VSKNAQVPVLDGKDMEGWRSKVGHHPPCLPALWPGVVCAWGTTAAAKNAQVPVLDGKDMGGGETNRPTKG